MGTLAKVGIFIVFLILFGAWLFANKKITVYMQNLFMQGRILISYELMFVNTLVGFFRLYLDSVWLHRVPPVYWSGLILLPFFREVG